MTRLGKLFAEQGQSPWLDNLNRSSLRSGVLRSYLDLGVRGITANPTTFEHAVDGSSDYDEQFMSLTQRHIGVEDAYWDLMIDDVGHALNLLRPLYDETGGTDGFVSLELSPRIAYDSEASVFNARSLHQQIDEPNLLVKIPATSAGVPAVRQLTIEGRSINVTLIFSLERYEQVIEAYLSGLEGHPGGLSQIHSVASFFLSRVDSEVDEQLGELGTEVANALKGRAAIAQAKLAYRIFTQRFSGPRWERLAARGARTQRLLWASTSSKTVAYPDTFYVDGLIAPDTINTMTEQTLAAFEDHGHVARTADQDIGEAADELDRLQGLGIDLGSVARTLEQQGVAAFVSSYEKVLAILSSRDV